MGDDLAFLCGSIEEQAPALVSKAVMLAYQEGIDSVLDNSGNIDLVDTLDQALAWQEAHRIDGAPPTWGDLHVASFEPPWGEPLQVPMDGDGTTINVAQCSMWDGGDLRESCETVHAAVFRQVTSFDEDGTPVMDFDQPLGEDGDVTRWSDGRYVPFPFREADVAAATERSFTLEPDGD